MSYFQDHGIKDSQRNQRPANPDIGLFMSNSPEVIDLFASLRTSANTFNLDTILSQLSESTIHPASSRFIASLSRTSSSNQCSICLDHAIEDGYTLPCNHEFHASCLDPWFKISNTCPFCRREYECEDEEYDRARVLKVQAEFAKLYPDDEEAWDPLYS